MLLLTPQERPKRRSPKKKKKVNKSQSPNNKDTTCDWIRYRGPNLNGKLAAKLAKHLKGQTDGRYCIFVERVIREYIKRQKSSIHLHFKDVLQLAVTQIFQTVRPPSAKPHKGDTNLAVEALFPIVMDVMDVKSVRGWLRETYAQFYHNNMRFHFGTTHVFTVTKYDLYSSLHSFLSSLNTIRIRHYIRFHLHCIRFVFVATYVFITFKYDSHSPQYTFLSLLHTNYIRHYIRFVFIATYDLSRASAAMAKVPNPDNVAEYILYRTEYDTYDYNDCYKYRDLMKIHVKNSMKKGYRNDNEGKLFYPVCEDPSVSNPNPYHEPLNTHTHTHTHTLSLFQAHTRSMIVRRLPK